MKGGGKIDYTLGGVELENWLRYLENRGRRPRTLEAYRYAVLSAQRFWSSNGGPIRLRAVSLTDLESWSRHLQDRGVAPITKEFYLLPLKAFYWWMERRGLIFRDPSQNLIVFRASRHLHDVVIERDVVRLLESIDGQTPVDLRDRAIIEIAYGAGLRCAEIAGLEVKSIDVAQRVVTVNGKGAKYRIVPLPRLAIEAIQRYFDQGRPKLVPIESNAMWSDKPHRQCKTMVRAVVKKRSQQVGLDLTPHDFRRAFATHMLRRGASPIDLQRLLGHSSFRQMQHYLRYVIADLKATHNRSRLSR